MNPGCQNRAERVHAFPELPVFLGSGLSLREPRNDGVRHRPRGGWPGGRCRSWFKEQERGAWDAETLDPILCESLSASPQLSNLRPSAASRSPKNPARSAVSVRPGPALLPRRIAYRAFAVSAPHLGLTLDLPELCRSTERAGLWGARTPSLARALLRRFDLPSLQAA